MIIGISGKKTAGKDTVGKIINIILSSPQLNDEGVATFLRKDIGQSYFTVKKFADKLKDMICMLIGCTREQLEDETFKNTELGKEWWYFKGRNGTLISYTKDSKRNDEDLVKPTPRLLMQLLGTECGREILHPNIWVNSVMADYKYQEKIVCCWGNEINNRKVIRNIGGNLYEVINKIYPNWIITDVRFPNEASAIKQRDGIIIRVNSKRCNNTDKHPSETSLDDYEFDDVIRNDGTIEELIEQVRIVLQEYKLI